MMRSNDPAHITVGVSMGSIADGLGSLMTTSKEVLTRLLHLVRLSVLAGPILVQCFYIHTVGFPSWLLRLLAIYVILGVLCFIAIPEQLYTGMGLGALRWVFEMFYPEIVYRHSGALDASERTSVSALRISDLNDVHARLRWYGTNRYLCLTREGWAVAGDETSSATFLLNHVVSQGKKVPDTYTFRVSDQASDWHHSWLSFQAINHLRFGGWLTVYRKAKDASPYKVVTDSACPPGACKLLCSWMGLPRPAECSCTGYYIAEQLSRGTSYLGHAPDSHATLFEIVLE